MSTTLQQITARVERELGDLYKLVREGDVEEWVLDGQAELEVFDKKTVTVTWAAGDTSITLPTDLVRIEAWRPSSTSTLPGGKVWGSSYVITETYGAPSSGTATLLYWAEWSDITSDDPATMRRVGIRAIVSYCVYRLYRRIAANRADYRLFATVTGQNDVSIEDLDALAERAYADFQTAADKLNVVEPAYFHDGR